MAAGKGALRYLSALLHDRTVASVAPSSRFVAERVAAAAAGRAVVELGPGAGVITRRLLRAMPRDGRLLAVELSADFMPALRRIRDARLTAVRGDARELRAHMRAAGMPRADAVASGVPMSLLAEAERKALLDDIRLSLRPGGRFVAYQVTPLLAPLLRERFREVETHFEARNLPPLFVLTARR